MSPDRAAFSSSSRAFYPFTLFLFPLISRLFFPSLYHGMDGIMSCPTFSLPIGLPFYLLWNMTSFISNSLFISAFMGKNNKWRKPLSTQMS
jgi:hypothetical protein